MRIEARGSLTRAAQTAVAALDEISGKVEDLAQHVAAGVRTEAGRSESAEIGSDLTELSLARTEAAADLRVFETAGDLLTQRRK
jgi:hypothetical protein